MTEQSTNLPKILLLGASGALGTAVLKELEQSERFILGIAGRSENPNYQRSVSKVFYADVTQSNSLATGIEWADLVINCSGLVSYFKKDRDQLFEVNFHGVRNIVECCLKFRKPLIHTSSAISYGSTATPLLFREDKTYPDTYKGAYAQSKAMADEIVIQSGVPHIILRPGTLFSTLTKLYSFYRKGWFPDLKGGASFTNLQAVAKAYGAAVDLFLHNPSSQIFNLGGHNLRFTELLPWFRTIQPQKVSLINPKVLHGLSILSEHLIYPASGRNIIAKENLNTGHCFTFIDSSKALKVLNYQIPPFENILQRLQI